MDAEVGAFGAGEKVHLVFSDPACPVVGVNRGGKRIHVPNPTLALVIRDGPYETPSGLTMVDALILDGPYRGSLVEAHSNVLRPVLPETVPDQQAAGILRRLCKCIWPD
jgi:hypothetical protein